MKPRPHAATIIEWANGAQIRYRAPGAAKWIYTNDPAWIEDYEYEVVHARVYPQSRMSYKEFSAAFDASNSHLVPFKLQHVANEAIRHAIDNGQVVPMSEVQEVARELAKNESPQWPPAVKKRLVDCLLDIRDSANRIFPTARINTPDGELLFSDYITRTLKAAAADVN